MRCASLNLYQVDKFKENDKELSLNSYRFIAIVRYISINSLDGSTITALTTLTAIEIVTHIHNKSSALIVID